MKLRYLLAVLLIAGSVVWSQNAAAPPSQPVAPVRPVTDDYFGTKVVDPYRYMENLKDPEVQAWFAGQNDYTRAVLASIPGRAKLLARIRELDQSVPGGSFPNACREIFYLIVKQLPTDDVSKLYLRSGANGEKIGCWSIPKKSNSRGRTRARGRATSSASRYPTMAGIW